MRLNGLTLALAALLAPATALAQQAPPAAPDAVAPAGGPEATPADETPAAPGANPGAVDAVPAEVAPAELAPNEVAPSEVAPNEVAPSEVAPNEVAPNEVVPSEVAPSEVAPTGAAPAEITPDEAAPTDAAPTATDSTPPMPSDDEATAQDGSNADPSTLAPTDAEKEFAEIYGQDYNPVADPSLPDPVNLPGAFDPWEKYNRKMHRFNNAVDRGVAKPLARGYVKVVPRPLRLGVSNFFSNLGQPLTAVNALLQGKPKAAGQALGRFLLNSTLGIGGIFDPARDAKIPHRNEDFGQTLGVWGWKRSRYVELPLFGPRTVRDVFGMVGDAPLSPLRRVEVDRVRVPLQGLQLVDLRSQLLSTDSLREGAEDDYILVRDAWSQRRDYQILGERAQDDSGLPDYLLEGEDQPTVPVDAMPVPPTGGGT